MAYNFQPVDFSKYAELRELWDKHPSNTQGAYARGGYIPAEGEAAQVLRRYGELSQQLADEVGGGELYTEAMMALGAVGGIGNGLTGENLGDPDYYKNMMDRRQIFLNQGRSAQDADSIDAYRYAAMLTGERQPDLNYVQAERARKYAAQYGTPEQYNYANELATNLRSAQPQSYAMQQVASQPYTTTTNYSQPNSQNVLAQAAMAQPVLPIYQQQSTMAQPQQATDQSSFRLMNMLAGQYNQPALQSAQVQQSVPQSFFGIPSMLGGQYVQPNFQRLQSNLQMMNPNRQLSQLNLGQTQRRTSLL